MVRWYNLDPRDSIAIAFAVILLTVMMLTGCNSALADVTGAGLNVYGFPIDIVPTGNGNIGVPGEGYSYSNTGYTLPDFGTTYGFQAHEVSPTLGGSVGGYIGPDLNGIDLGVAFGLTQADHDASKTAFSKDLYYESSLDNTFMGFPGLGVGSLGVGFPTITNQKSDIKYMESVKFEFSTESDKLQVGGFGFPLGLGLGYTSAMVGTGPASSIPNSLFFFH